MESLLTGLDSNVCFTITHDPRGGVAPNYGRVMAMRGSNQSRRYADHRLLPFSLMRAPPRDHQQSRSIRVVAYDSHYIAVHGGGGVPATGSL
jgi:hypothetical protein